ncbi:hypothetical protein CCYA_CCYA13G3557 [Cyanidiococcus yangmingshanensis]|nr:hypothetical protein CCYA_CCYA13G3557 [Cyanidiococcus yangmingshanensis]
MFVFARPLGCCRWRRDASDYRTRAPHQARFVNWPRTSPGVRSPVRAKRSGSYRWVQALESAEPPTDETQPKSHSSLSYTGKGEYTKHMRLDTKTVHAGSHPEEYSTDPYGRTVVNPPVYHASTVLFPTVAAKEYASKDWPLRGFSYGRHGTPTHWALEEAFAALEGGDNACCVSSGVAACNAALLAFLRTGDHVLVADTVYEPTRLFCDRFLARFGVETTYYDPTTPMESLEPLFKSNGRTKVVFVESPGSLSLEVQDIPAVSALAHTRGAVVVMDNTYGPTLFRPFEAGVDVSYNAATKYIGGHSDLMMGLIACSRETYRKVKRSVMELGCPPGPDDCYLALRGLRTLTVRLKQHEQNGLVVARWLEARPEVARVIHPLLPSHPQHHLFIRDFRGANGLFTIQLRDMYAPNAVNAFIDSLKLFGLGYSWGGYESLILPIDINAVRSVAKFKYGDGYGPTLRLHVGLEDPHDLCEDLAQALVVLNKVAGVVGDAALFQAP